MDEAQRLDIFRAQTKNVQKLNQVRKQINRTINYALRKGDTTSAEIHTRVLALIFCAWVEAQFSKVVHTPYGFTLDEIRQIKEIYQCNGAGVGWETCVELGLRKVVNSPKSNYIPNVRQKLFRIIGEYVVEPSLIRNKIAHGQWEIALNRENTAINNELSNKLHNLDTVSVNIWFDVHSYLAEVVEVLIESPDRAFHRDYWVHVTNLEEFVREAANLNLAEKIKRLQKKPLKRD
jgi:hypothetical protein